MITEHIGRLAGIAEEATPQIDRTVTMNPVIPDEELLRRAVRMARDYHAPSPRNPRWVGVMHAFQIGSTYAAQLCRRFGLDPDEMVRR